MKVKILISVLLLFTILSYCFAQAEGKATRSS